MCISGLMVSESEFRCGDPGIAPLEGRVWINELFNFFEGFNEEIMDKKQKEVVLWWNVGKTPLEGGTGGGGGGM